MIKAYLHTMYSTYTPYICVVFLSQMSIFNLTKNFWKSKSSLSYSWNKTQITGKVALMPKKGLRLKEVRLGPRSRHGHGLQLQISDKDTICFPSTPDKVNQTDF